MPRAYLYAPETMRTLVTHKLEHNGSKAKLKLGRLVDFIESLDDYSCVERKFLQASYDGWNSTHRTHPETFGYEVLDCGLCASLSSVYEKTEVEQVAAIAQIWHDLSVLGLQTRTFEEVDIFLISNSPAMQSLAVSLKRQFAGAVTLYVLTQRPEKMGSDVEVIDVKSASIMEVIC